MNSTEKFIRSLRPWAAAMVITIALLSAANVQAQDKSAGGGSGQVDLATANQAFANPLAQATLAITENDTVWMGGDLDKGSRRTNITLIEPLIPLRVGHTGWSLVNRPILPIAYSADVPVEDEENGVPFIDIENKDGLGDFTFFTLLTPTKTKTPFKWGIGPIFRFPTATKDELGAEKYSFGPAAVAAYSSAKLTFGALSQNLFSYAGNNDRREVELSTLQYFIFYNFTDEWGIGTAPIISVDWNAEKDGDKWLVPIGLGVTRTFRLGKVPARALLEGQRYIVRKDSYGPEWNIRLAFALFFPAP